MLVRVDSEGPRSSRHNMLVAPLELRQALDSGNLIVVVGPALSIAAGLPSIPDLGAQLVETAIQRGIPVDRDRLRGWLGHGRAAEALGLIERHLGAEFQRQIERRLSDQGAAVPRLAVLLAGLCEHLRAIYTTNLDRLLERALADRWPSFAMPRADLAQRRHLVFKLRGTLEFAQSWVLTRQQQELEFSSRSLRRSIFEAAYNAHELLFIGFAADSDVLGLLLDAIEQRDMTSDQRPAHFIIVEHCSLEERESLERRGLEVVSNSPEAVLIDLAKQCGGGLRPEPPVMFDGSPYPGLRAFEESDMRLFFGRHAEISQAAARLGGLGNTHRRWLAIEGPSGVGKSSFIQAGVVPALRRGFGIATPTRWKVAIFRPGTQPMTHLVRALCDALELDESPDQILAEFSKPAPPGAADLLAPLVRRIPTGHGVLVVIEQLEELSTQATPNNVDTAVSRWPASWSADPSI